MMKVGENFGNAKDLTVVYKIRRLSSEFEAYGHASNMGKREGTARGAGLSMPQRNIDQNRMTLFFRS